MTFFLTNAWAIPLLPLLGCLLITFTPIRHNGRASGWLASGLMLAAALLAIGLLAAVAQASAPAEAHAAGAAHGFSFPAPAVEQRFSWAPTGSGSFQMGIYIDGVAAAMLAMVTITATCIHIFSIGYMAANPRQGRFFSFIALFSAAMLLMCMADNLLLFFMAWEIMGLCSYLLIGFLYERPQAYRAALKAFITTRVGDVLMLLGLVYLYTQAGALSFGSAPGQIFDPALLAQLGEGRGALGLSHASGIALLLFCGTIGKAAQFPLHVWLPDAMEGPTPVSALIHAATMVAAGVFLVARTYPLFNADDGTARLVVSFIGAFTALFGATMAVAQFNIKRILAYSTMSQLGFMVAALGIGGWVAAIFHLLTHAFFKALLFLGSGSIIHAMEQTKAIEDLHVSDDYAAQQTAQDIRNMGGLRELMPWTFWTYTLGYLALAGIAPLAGFWSKDEILADAFKGGHWVAFSALSLAAFLTAFYMTRQWRLVFWGSFRGERPLVYQNPEPVPAHAQPGGPHHAGDAPDLPHENGPSMIAPLVVLASFALTAGLLNLPFGVPGGHWLSDLFGQEHAEFSWLVAGISLALAVAGCVTGWVLYDNIFVRADERDPIDERAPGLFALLQSGYRVDGFYAASVGRLTTILALAWAWLDRNLLDRLVNGVGRAALLLGQVNYIVDDTLLNDGPDALASGALGAGRQTRRTQTGKAQDYLGYMFGGVVLLALVYLYVIR
jgi:NADH-quinone oxidoreductase subunit L